MRAISVIRPSRFAGYVFRFFSVSCLAAVIGAAYSEVQAQSKGLAGYWRGSGYVSPVKGQRERVRCLVWITQISGKNYNIKAKCASQAVNIDQVANVRKTGGSSYTGTFHNSDFNIRGRIRITLRGNRQSVALSSKEGSGRLTLFRR